LSSSRAVWPKAAVHQQAICSASGPTPAWDSISECDFAVHSFRLLEPAI